jgi:glycerate 2-kinase
MNWDDARARTALRAIFDAAVAAADPRRVLADHLPPPPAGRCVVVGAGKSASVMAAALETAWPDVKLSGVVVTRHGHAVPTAHIRVIEAAHPVPDDNSEVAARAMMAAVQGLGSDDLVLALMSGGASSLLTLPPPGMTLADKQAVNRALLMSGATIHEMNAVRKHLSAIKGGRLAQAAAPARVVTLAISDVPGDDPGVIGSGPTVPDPTTAAEARTIVDRYRIALPASARARLARDDDETPKPGSLPHATFRMIATPSMALAATAEIARAHGLTPLVLGDAIEGEAAIVGTVMAGIARGTRRHGTPIAPPAVLLSGGETTVTIDPDGRSGRGGRNTEFLLGLAVALGGEQGIWAMAADTDGIDGTEDAAGAMITPTTLARAVAHGLDPRGRLTAHDSYTVFAALDDLIITGPTLTNVNDVRAIVVA